MADRRAPLDPSAAASHPGGSRFTQQRMLIQMNEQTPTNATRTDAGRNRKFISCAGTQKYTCFWKDRWTGNVTETKRRVQETNGIYS